MRPDLAFDQNDLGRLEALQIAAEGAKRSGLRCAQSGVARMNIRLIEADSV